MNKFKSICLYALITSAGITVFTLVILFILKRYALEGVMVFGVTCVAAFWGWVIRWLKKDGRLTVSHILVIWMVASGTVMGGASYYLAYKGIDDTLETLSRYVMVETVAGSVGYFIKSAIENTADKVKGIKKNNDL